MTNYSNQCKILAELYLLDPTIQSGAIQEFIEINTIGLPAAYLIHEGIVLSTQEAETYINETWDSLMSLLSIDDADFESLEEVMDAEPVL